MIRRSFPEHQLAQATRRPVWRALRMHKVHSRSWAPAPVRSQRNQTALRRACPPRPREDGRFRLSVYGEDGQMAVELAVLLPVVIVVALITYNLGRFVEACAAFDRVALDAVVAHGVAPAGEQSSLAAASEVQTCISEALAMSSCDVKVEAASRASASPLAGISFPISPLLTTYTCTLSYTPWPHSVSFGPVSFRPPVRLTHTRTLVVDRFRPGVVV